MEVNGQLDVQVFYLSSNIPWYPLHSVDSVKKKKKTFGSVENRITKSLPSNLYLTSVATEMCRKSTTAGEPYWRILAAAEVTVSDLLIY
jgi:hypothetical protein